MMAIEANKKAHVSVNVIVPVLKIARKSLSIKLISSPKVKP